MAIEFVDDGDKGKKKDGGTPVLDNFSKDLIKLAEQGKLDPVIGRQKEILRIAQVLSRRKKNNPIIIGEPGAGKTAIVEGLAMMIHAGECPKNLADKRIVSLDINSIVAGTKYRGQFEERMKVIIEELQSSPNIIIFIDEIHTMVGAGNSSGSLDASNIFKPALSRGEIQCIGATTLDEYRKHFEKDGALERRFQKIIVDPSTKQETFEILKQSKEKYEEHHKVNYTDEALWLCVELADRYITDREFPDKAFDILDEVGSRMQIDIKLPEHIEQLKQEATDIKQEKADVIKKQKYEMAAELRDREKSILMKLDEEKKKFEDELRTSKRGIPEDLIYEVLSKFSSVASEENIAALTGLNKLPNIEVAIKDEANSLKKLLEKRKTSGGSLTDSELILINDSIKSMESKAAGNTKITNVVNGVKAEVDLIQNQNNLKSSEEVVTTKTTIDLDTTQGGKIEPKKEPEITTNTNDSSSIDIHTPNYEWRFGGDLENYVGEFKSEWFNEDLLDANKFGNFPDPLADKPMSYIDKLKNEVDEEFPEADYFSAVIKKMREGFSMIEHGNVRKDTWDYFPTGGFERYGIDNFREWIKKLYNDKRLKVKTYATDFWSDHPLGFDAPREEWKHSGPLDPSTETFFSFEVLPKSDKNLWNISLKNKQKTPFETEYFWKLERIKNDPKLTEKEKSDETLKAYNEYFKNKEEARERDKYWYKFGMKTPRQDPDLNESIIKDINKIKRLL